MKTYCNPLNFNYRYQFNQDKSGIVANRESADPSMICFQGRYYIFPSMTAGFLYSDDMIRWDFHEFTNLPIYDYAPDVRVVGDYIYFCASSHEHGVHYRTKDPFSDVYEKMDGAFPFWDPNLFCDEDGRLYFYWGSSTTEPLYGIELDAKTLQPLGEKVSLCHIDTGSKGFERNGENHVKSRSKEETDAILAGLDSQPMPESMKEAARNYILELPYMEGVWVNKHDGIYYLQYGTPSSGHNIYGDGVYVSQAPLGPYTLAKNNPFSYKPGGFIPGAGHGSTMEDRDGDIWHVSTGRICMNHNFERRIGIWPSGYDADGDLFCNQRFGDWPVDVEASKKDAWTAPQWMLLSHNKKMTASSTAPDRELVDAQAAATGRHVVNVTSYTPSNACDENIQTWWKADTAAWLGTTKENPITWSEEDSSAIAYHPQWLQLDLGQPMDVHSIQINFADDKFCPNPMPKGLEITDALMQQRWIDTAIHPTRWLLEGSLDGVEYQVLADKRDVTTDLPHDYIELVKGQKLQYIRLTITETPYGQTPAISGLRVFGLGDGDTPAAAEHVTATLSTPLDLDVSWTGTAIGYVINWGYSPKKLYHSYMVYGNHETVGGLVKDQPLYVRVDAFNENGITEGAVIQVR